MRTQVLKTTLAGRKKGMLEFGEMPSLVPGATGERTKGAASSMINEGLEGLTKFKRKFF